jgi:hypothetical protein
MSAAKPPRRSVRSDPVNRRVDGVSQFARVNNRDPNKHYVMVPLASEAAPRDMDSDYYEAMGYEIVRKEPGGPRFGAGGSAKKDGDPLVNRGHVLMCCTRERYEEIVQHGADGQSGQELSDQLTNRLVRKGGFDPLRGMMGRMGPNGPYVEAVAEIGKLTTHTGVL